MCFDVSRLIDYKLTLSWNKPSLPQVWLQCIFFICLWVCVSMCVNICMCVGTPVCAALPCVWLMAWVFMSHSPPSVLRQDVSLEPRACQLGDRASQLAPGLHLLSSEITVQWATIPVDIYVGAGSLNSVLTEPSHELQLVLISSKIWFFMVVALFFSETVWCLLNLFIGGLCIKVINLFHSWILLCSPG